MKLKDKFYPSLLASECFYPYISKEDILLDAIEKMMDEGYYKRVEAGTFHSEKQRARLSHIVEQHHIGYTQWITNDIATLGLNPASVDKEIRQKTIGKMMELVDMAAESGADRIAMVSGPDPGERLREEARQGLKEVLQAVLEKIETYPRMRLLLEPLDRDAHKKHLIGPSDEAVQMVELADSGHGRCLLSWDSAHAALNDECLGESLRVSAPCLGHIHLANAILAPGQSGYGDWHMRMGRPGFLDVPCGTDILTEAASVWQENVKLGVSVECRCPAGCNPFQIEAECRAFLERILEHDVTL